jgi:O-acetyl-ADP-ribose deacetylase (regulator of RNase III)
MKFELVKGDLLQQKVEVIVVSANNDLILGGGLSGVIRRTAGKAILEECEKIGTVPLGAAAVTGAGELPFKHVFHAAVKPIGLFADARSIRSAIQQCFREAAKRKIQSIGFPVVGSGGGSYPIEKATQILIEEALRAAREPGAPERVVLAVAEDKAMEAVEPVVRQKVPAEMLVTTVPPTAPAAPPPGPTASPPPPSPPPAGG